MAARPQTQLVVETGSEPASPATQPLLLFVLLFAGLILLHAPLLRLPYFWDEAGYYVPAARDLYLSGSPIPQSTLSNLHPPLVMAWLALAWRLFGYSTLVTRTAMLALAAFSLAGLFRLARTAANSQVAWAVVVLTALYPVFFAQSSLAQVDLAAAGFTFWALADYLRDRPWKQALWFSLAALAKETAIIAPAALFLWQIITVVVRDRREELLPPKTRRTRAFHLAIPVVPLVCWFGYHYAKTGFVLGNPDFLHYNLLATLNPLRIPLAFVMRLWQAFGYFGLYVLSLAALLAMFLRPQIDNGDARPRIAIWQQAALAVVSLAYLLFMSVVGGAVLARYLLPATPLVILAAVATLWRRARYWKLIVGAIAIIFVVGLFSNPPYGFSLEDNLAYRDYVVMHVEAAQFLARDPNARVLTAWPASDELTWPWLGYVARRFRVVRIEDFTGDEVERASAARSQYDVALVFSTKYRPRREFFENWAAWQRTKEKFFGYHRDLLPDDIARQLGGKIVYHKEVNGQWIAVIGLEGLQK